MSDLDFGLIQQNNRIFPSTRLNSNINGALSLKSGILWLNCYVYWISITSNWFYSQQFSLPYTLLCFFKFVSRANNSKSCPPNNWPRLKYVAIYIFLEQTTLQTCGFWAGEALEAWTWDYFNITVAQKWHSAIFQISAEKSFPACQKGSCTFLSNFGCCDLQKLCGKTSKFIQ